MKAIIVLFVLAVAGCAPVCKTTATRCEGTLAQVCNAKGDWQRVMDCNEVRPGQWRCAQPDAGLATCLPADGGGE